MIEDKIQQLRQAAKITSNNDETKKMWCVIAGNDKLVNDIVYASIAAKNKVKILFREHVTVDEAHIQKKFDFIMINGDYLKIRELSHICKDNGGAYIQISPNYIGKEPNLMLLVGPEDTIKKFVGDTEKQNIEISILLEDQTTGFVETDLQVNFKLPEFIKSILSPLFNMSDVVLSAILISVENTEDTEKVEKIATYNKLFIIDFKDIEK